MSDLFQLVRDHIEAFDQVTQDWQTATGTKTITQSIARPAAWIERVHERGVMTALDCVSIIVFALDDWSVSPTREQQIQLAEGWAAELRKAAQAGEIQPRDPFTLLPLNCTPDGWEWGVLASDVDKFLAARGIDWECGEIAAHIYNQVLPDIDAKRFPVELRSIEKPQAAPEPAPVVEAPANEPGNWKMKIQAEAAARFIRLRAVGASPTPHSILDDMVKWCRANEVKTDGGIFPSAGYLRTHVLGGKHWMPPP